MDFLSGYKTHILAALTILVGAAALLTGQEIMGVAPADAFQTIWAGVALFTGRSALAKISG